MTSPQIQTWVEEVLKTLRFESKSAMCFNEKNSDFLKFRAEKMFAKLIGRNKSEPRSNSYDINTTVDMAREFHTVLTPIDMRHLEYSGKAIGIAAEIAKGNAAKFYLLTVLYPFGKVITDMPEHHEPEFREFVAQMEKQTGVSIEPVFRSHESASKVISDVAREIDVDLIVMASHDPRIADHIFRSNASEVALHTKCSVLVVR